MAILSGMTAIQDYCRSINMQSSSSVINDLIKYEFFPAKKLGGVWESDGDLIVIWRRQRLLKELGIEPTIAAPEQITERPELKSKNNNGSQKMSKR
jgi:hypothetical protein